jgi:hypothetical protein
LSTLNRTAAEIAAAALFETFPDVKLLGGRETAIGFSYDFYYPHPISPQMEIILEERMRQIARERRPIRTLEMVPVSARQFLIKEGRSSRLDEIDPDEGLVEIIQIGSFIDLSYGPHLKNSHELSSFKLWPIETLQKGEYRIAGCAFDRKEDLKEFLKKFRAYKEKSHLWIGEKKSLWKIWQREVIWLQAGLKGRSDLIELLKEHLFKESLEIGSSSLEDRLEMHANLASEINKLPLHIGEIYQTPASSWDPDAGLFSLQGGGVIQISSYVSSVDFGASLISSLQSVEKTLNILGFKYSLLLVGHSRSEKSFQRLVKALEGCNVKFEVELKEKSVSQIDLLLEDNLGRRWAGFSWNLMEKGFYLIGSIERLYALLLERSI